MKKFTKIMIGAGLTVAALGAAAAPANAANQGDASIAAAGDRLEGPAIMSNNTWDNFYITSGFKFGSDKLVDAGEYDPNGVKEIAARAAAGSMSIPAVGETGPVKFGDMCVTRRAGYDRRTDLKACTGTAEQDFLTTPEGYLKWTAAANDSYLDLHTDANGTAVIVVREGSLYVGSERVMLGLFSPVGAVVVPVDITGATTDARPVFTGTGDAGATVVITLDDGTEIGTGTVGADGTWSIPSTVDIADGSTHFTATQTATDGSESTDDITVTIVGTPVVDPIMAGGAALALLAAAGVVAAKRREAAGATA